MYVYFTLSIYYLLGRYDMMLSRVEQELLSADDQYSIIRHASAFRFV